MELRDPIDLHQPDGTLTRSGWARRPLWRFDAARVPRTRHTTAWDFFTVMSPRAAANFTLARIGRIQVCAVDLIDFGRGGDRANVRLLRGDGLQLSAAPRGPAVARGRRTWVRYDLAGPQATLSADLARLLVLPAIQADIALDWPDADESLNCVFPFPEQPGGFFYECKVAGMPATGSLRVGADAYHFDPSDSFGVLDWARGLWPKRAFWRWGAFAGWVDGRRVGANFGHGFGDQSEAGENALFVDGHLHKLGDVDWQLDRSDYSRPWRLVGKAPRCELTFEPVYVHRSNLELLLFGLKARRVFGWFLGQAELEDGTMLDIPRAVGFGEEVWFHT
ncbi:MAG: DUF2804 domain-containing protein [Candidatus Dadabacteria bacterium]|nr:MAG: DUF2804 domain-containing protein [Candidatus Dadabacteria bacterium]